MRMWRHFTFRMLSNSAHGFVRIHTDTQNDCPRFTVRHGKANVHKSVSMRSRNRTQNPPQLFFACMLSNKSVRGLGGGDTCSVHVYPIKRGTCAKSIEHTHAHIHAYTRTHTGRSTRATAVCLLGLTYLGRE